MSDTREQRRCADATHHGCGQCAIDEGWVSPEELAKVRADLETLQGAYASLQTMKRSLASELEAERKRSSDLERACDLFEENSRVTAERWEQWRTSIERADAAEAEARRLGVAAMAEDARAEAAEANLSAKVAEAVEAEKQRCLAIVHAQPNAPDTHTGTRQQWVKDRIAEAIERGDNK